MTVRREEASDRKFTETADIVIGGKRFENQAVYGDTADPTRRDIFPPSELSDRDRLPKKAKVRWHGRTYTAKLSFRRAAGGKPIPVYTFNVQG